LLNSKVIEYFHKITSGNTLYAKRFRYWASYLNHYPISKSFFDSPNLRAELIANVSRLINSNNDEERVQYEKENDKICYQLFDLSEDDIQEIELTLSIHSSNTSKKGISKKCE